MVQEVKTISLKIDELVGATLNWAAAKALGKLDEYERDHKEGNGQFHLYSTDYDLGGEIIEKKQISTQFIHENLWLSNNAFAGRTHIEAAIRFLVWDSLGDDVEVPLEQYRYEQEIATLAEKLETFSDEKLYEMRVKQLENEELATSDAQACADYEEGSGVLLSKVKANLHRQPYVATKIG